MPVDMQIPPQARTKPPSAPNGFNFEAVLKTQDVDTCLELLEHRRTIIYRTFEREEARSDHGRVLAEIDEYQARLRDEKLTDINRRKIEAHMILLHARRERALMLIEQVDIELAVLRAIFTKD